VNGEAFAVCWGLDRPVHDEEGHEALGACETDPDLPGTVLISINESLLSHQPEVVRSTAVHEFAHAIFDMPAAISGHRRRAFRTSFAPALARPGAAMEWAEWRAQSSLRRLRKLVCVRLHGRLPCPRRSACAIASQARQRLRLAAALARFSQQLPLAVYRS
jgi:hypothetical protein